MTDAEKPKTPNRILPPAPPAPNTPRRPPAPAPGADTTGASQTEAGKSEAGGKPDPTRFGDWEKNGRCIDF